MSLSLPAGPDLAGPDLAVRGLAARIVVAQDAAYLAGVVIGRLLFLGLGVWLLTTGFRRRRDPASRSRGTGFIIGGALVLLAVVAGLTATAGTSGTSP